MTSKSSLKAQHAGTVMTEAWAKRLLKGATESKPSDYRITVTEKARLVREARLRLEDLAIARELGID